MKILWCVSGLMRPPESAMKLTDSTVASHRYRIGYPSLYLERFGHESRIVTLSEDASVPSPLDADCAVFGKLTAQGPEYFPPVRSAALRTAQQLHTAKVPIIVDICDFQFFPGEPRGETVRELITVADAVTCNSEEMASMVKAAVHDCPQPVVIPDPVEQRREAPSSIPALRAATKTAWSQAILSRLTGRRPDAVVRLLWFGHPSNMGYLLRHLKSLSMLGHRIRCRLTVCTSDHPQVAMALAAARKETGDLLDIRFLEWTTQSIGEALHDTDIVIIPADPNDPAKRAAGNNRLIEALWAGRFVVANELPSYREFADHAWIGEDLSQGIIWALDSPERARKRVENAQRKIEQEYTQEQTGRRWMAILAQATGQERFSRT